MNVIVPHGFETNYTAGFALGLKANGIRFVVISSDADEQIFSAHGIDHINLRGSVAEDRPALTKIANLARYYLRILRYLLRHRHCTLHFIGTFRNELLLIEGLVLPAMFRLLAKRYLYTAHNVLPHGKSGIALYRFVYRWVYRLPDTIVVNTALAGEQIVEQFGIPEERILVSSIGFNDEVPSTDLARQGARTLLGLEPSQKVLLFFGKISHYKGLDMLIEALERIPVPDLRLVIAGSFTDAHYRSAVMAQISDSSRRSDILLHERHIPNEEVEVFFKAADLLVLPYRNIYQSGLIFLSMRFGMPVVATDVGSMKDYLEPDMGLVAPSNDAAGIALAVQQFFDQPERFDARVIFAKGLDYDWKNVCRGLVALYDQPDQTGAKACRK